jgi:hypothetical protein
VPSWLMCNPTESQDGADLSWDPHLNPLADDVENDVDEDDADATFDASAEAEEDTIDTDAGVRGLGGPASQGKPRSALPRWLKQSYSSVCQELQNGMVKNARGVLVPKCYVQGSFFFSEENCFLALDGRRQLSPTMFYEPWYFVWLPHVFARIPCPSCNNSSAFLSPHSMARSPRRAVDIDRVVYIIGQRYRCLKCGRSFQGWSKPVLDVLPPALSAQFPFHLTHRGGLSDALVALLRSCFQRGIGPSPFAEMIRSFHQRTYEKTYLQYLEMVLQRSQVPLFGQGLALHEPFSAWDDPGGYAGFVPSPKYFRTFYNNLIKRHAPSIDQHMAMLSARFLSMDLSFKVCGFHRIPMVIGMCTDHDHVKSSSSTLER